MSAVAHARTCGVAGCGRPHYGRGYCRTHWVRWRRHGDPTVTLRPRGRVCEIADCGGRHYGHGLCHGHWLQHRRAAGGAGIPRPVRCCAVLGCGRPHYGRGYCRTHHARWRRGGHPGAEQPIGVQTRGAVSYWSVRRRLTAGRGPASAHRCAECGAGAVGWSYDGADPDPRTDPGRGYRYSLDLDRYRPRCRSCHRRATTTRHPRGAPRGCRVAGCGHRHQARGLCAAHYHRWRRHGDPGADLPVDTAAAVSYWSVHQRLKTDRGPASAQRCAECGTGALDWSYDGTDPDQRTDPGRGYRYSLDLARYRPRCRSCHRRATLYGPGGGGLDVERAARLYRAGASARGIGTLLGASPGAVLAALRAHGVTIRPGGRAPRPRA